MFSIGKDENLLTFSIEREEPRFGEGTRFLFWIDLGQQVLQRGRQESIPIGSIDSFGTDEEGKKLFCRLGRNKMILFAGENVDPDKLRAAAVEIAEFCGVEVF